MGPRTLLRSSCYVQCCLLVSVLALPHCIAQSPKDGIIGHATRDPDAESVIQKAIAALGGDSASEAIKDSATHATCTRTAHSQTTTHQLRWITNGEQFRVDHGTEDGKAALAGPQGRSIALADKVKSLSEQNARAFRPFHVPLNMLRKDLRPKKLKIELLDDEVIGGISAAHIRITDLEATEGSIEPVSDEWFFDKSTFLPLRVKYLVFGLGSARRFADTTIDYSNYQPHSASGILMPMTFRRSLGVGLSTSCNISNFAVNQSPNSQMFTRSQNGASN